MKLNSLSLHFFKNHSHFEWTMQSSVLGIHGLNGKGKTNILDAICYLCSAKSYFSATDSLCIMEGEQGASIIAEIEEEQELKIELKLRLNRNSRKRLEKNGKAYDRLSDYLGQFFAVVIAPGDIELIYGHNEVRRNFINRILAQSQAPYLRSLLKYNALLDQRNKHLKQDFCDDLLLEAIDAQIAPEATLIYEHRQVFLNEFIKTVQEYYHQLSGGKEALDIHYISQLLQGNYFELSRSAITKDKILQRSSIGIHKDEIEFLLNGNSCKKFASQGQIKSFLIALKLAEYDYYKNNCGQKAFLLLDDIFEKIDEERAAALTGIIKNGTFGQIFITDTQKQRLETFCKGLSAEYELIALP